MNKNRNKLFTLEILSLPDCSCPHYRLQHSKDMFAAIIEACDTILSELATYSFGNASIHLVVILPANIKLTGTREPEPARLYLVVVGNTRASSKSFMRLINSGTLSELYEFKESLEPPLLNEGAKYIAQLIRCEEHHLPSVKPEFNPNIPDYYKNLKKLNPNPDFDYSNLTDIERAMDGDIAFEIALAPVDATSLRVNLSEYVRKLRESTNIWSDDDHTYPIEALQPDHSYRYDSGPRTSFRYHRDLIGEHVLREQEDFAKSLFNPQLKFSVRAYAKNQSDAKIALTMLASNAFLDRNYTIVEETATTASFAFDDSSEQWATPCLNRSHEQLNGCEQSATLCTPEEISSLFRLPVGGIRKDCIFRVATDPSNLEQKESLWIGSCFYRSGDAK